MKFRFIYEVRDPREFQSRLSQLEVIALEHTTFLRYVGSDTMWEIKPTTMKDPLNFARHLCDTHNWVFKGLVPE